MCYVILISKGWVDFYFYISTFNGLVCFSETLWFPSTLVPRADGGNIDIKFEIIKDETRFDSLEKCMQQVEKGESALVTCFRFLLGFHT